MAKTKQNLELKDAIVEAIKQKKGHEIVIIDLTENTQAVADYYIICHGNSSSQVDAITDNIERFVRTETSEHPFSGAALLRLYFGNPPLEQMTNLYMFTPAYSVKNFDVSRFEMKKGKRYLTGISASITGSAVGVSSADDLQIDIKEVRAGVYDIKVTGKPGEYCLMFTANGASGFGGVFDFTIK